jgi:hypothetical protein
MRSGVNASIQTKASRRSLVKSMHKQCIDPNGGV